MNYALNLDQEGRILSATYPQYAPADAPRVDTLPEGDVSDYRYVDGEYIYDPLPEPEQPEQPEPVEPTPDDSNVWDELDAAYQEGVDSV